MQSNRETGIRPSRNYFLLAWSAFVAAALWQLAPASSTTVLEMNTEEMTARADLILRGRVLSSESLWDDSRTKIFTEYLLEVEECFKGVPGETRKVSVRQWGGVVGDRGYYIPGVATFAPNEDVFAFFTSPNPRSGTRFTVGLSQGKYSVLDEESSGKELLRRNLRGLTYYDAISDRSYEPEPEEAPVYYDDIRTEVRNYLGQGHESTEESK